VKNLNLNYIKELAKNHDIHGTPRILAEWNWNNTALLSDGARRGSIMKVYDAKNVGAINSTSFPTIFTEDRYRKTLNPTSVNFDHESNRPNIDWTKDYPNFNPFDWKHFGIYQEFYLEVKEPGTWRFAVASDDSHELWVENTKISQFYGGRIMQGAPNYTEVDRTYNFPTAGRYRMRAYLHNIDIEWGMHIGYKTPSMHSRNEEYQPLDSELTIHPDHVDEPYDNPEVIGYRKDNPAVADWLEWREHFPVSSLTAPLRPKSGIRYNELTSRKDDAYIMDSSFYKEGPEGGKKTRWYLLDKDNNQFRYWRSDQVSNANKQLAGATVRITYTQPVGANKITFTANLGPKPTSMTIRYLTEGVNGEDQWITILNPNSAVPINTKTGEIIFNRAANGDWIAKEGDVEQIYTDDYSVRIRAIEFTIHSLDTANARADVIEFSARKVLDISERVARFEARLAMDEEDFTRILGIASANDGSIELSNWDNAFQLDEDQYVGNTERLKQTVERSTKFMVDLMYDLSEQGQSDPYPVRMFTFYSADWTREGEYDYSINLFDSAKFLQNLPCPEIFEHDVPVHVLIAQILDSVGFTNYSLDKEDYDLSAPVLDHFANDPEDTVWSALQIIAESAMCAIFFDQNDVLQIMTREQITKQVTDFDYTLRGIKVNRNPEIPETSIDPDEGLPNISELEKRYDMEANKVTIKWRPKAIKTNKDPLFGEQLTDIVWQSSDTIVLKSTKLMKPMGYDEEDSFHIRQEDALTWPFQGKGNINGEVVEWDAKEYYWIDGETGKTYFEFISSDEQWKKRQNKAIYGYNLQGVNKFTGRIRLKRDPKTNKPVGRGADSSKYRIDHYTGMRPGWKPARFTIGNAGFQDGYWPGEQNTSFYEINNPNERTTAIGINRPTNANDDWFKTQCIYRKDSTMQKPLQQWGFRMKFKESTTIGEVSLMFNMGYSTGNSEVVSTSVPVSQFNQMYHVTFLETQNLVRNATHEIGAWVQSPDPVYRTHDNAIRGSASRMYNRNYHEPWAERMKGYRFEFKRNVWYDVKVDLTRGRGYALNSDMHFFVWINGMPVAGFNAAGPADRHKWLAPTNYWAIGSRAASKVEIANAYSWTEFADPYYEDDQWRYDFTTKGFVSSYLENGVLHPAAGKTAPYRNNKIFDGNLFYDDFGSTVREIREYDITLDKAPVETLNAVISNENARVLNMDFTANKAKFSIVNLSDSDTIVHGTQELGNNQSVNHSMVLFGYVLEEGEEQEIVRRDRESIKDHGEVSMDIDATWINSVDQADDLAQWVVEHFADPKDVLQIGVFGDTSFSVGDKVKIIYPKAEINKEWVYIVSGINMAYADEGLDVVLTVRRVRNNPLDDAYEYPNNAVNPVPDPEPAPPAPKPETPTFTNLSPISGMNESTYDVGRVAGTDLLIPFRIDGGNVAYLAGDSFAGDMPGSPDWRSPVGFKSNTNPLTNKIVFQSAYNTNASNFAADMFYNQKSANEYNAWGQEFTVIPNDGVYITSKNMTVVSYMSVNRWRNAKNDNLNNIPGDWRTNYAGLAYSTDGQNFTRLPVGGNNAVWSNAENNSSAFQMQSMYYNSTDDYVYMISVKSGRQSGPMYLQRVRAGNILYRSAWQGYYKDGNTWKWGKPDQCTSLFSNKMFGEPSLRKLADGTWVMSYLTNSIGILSGGPFGIVTRTAPDVTGPWSAEKVQLTQWNVPRLYGGFIHPSSTKNANGLILLVSQWTDNKYHVMQFRGTV